MENRLIVGPGPLIYAYDPGGKRVKKVGATQEYYFYGIGGQKLATMVCVGPEDGSGCGVTQYNVYFGGKLVKSKGVVVVTDRLGSVRANSNGERMTYYPYGEEKTGTADGREKFGTYTRDSATTDYADQRYYAVGTGRFNTADPMGVNGATPGTPASWNRYAYVSGDPVNFNDPTGSLQADPSIDYNSPGYCGWGVAVYVDGMPYACYGGGGGGDGGGDGATGGGDEELTPECFAQLKDRPVDDPKAAKANAVHTFWWVQDSTGAQYIISGGPTPANSSGTQYLNVSGTLGSNNGSGDNSSAHTDWSSGLSWINCDQVDTMLGAARNWQNNHNTTIVYNPLGALGIGGPNSNSAAHYFGVIAGFNPKPPATAYGWWSPIIFP